MVAKESGHHAALLWSLVWVVVARVIVVWCWRSLTLRFERLLGRLCGLLFVLVNGHTSSLVSLIVKRIEAIIACPPSLVCVARIRRHEPLSTPAGRGGTPALRTRRSIARRGEVILLIRILGRYGGTHD